MSDNTTYAAEDFFLGIVFSVVLFLMILFISHFCYRRQYSRRLIIQPTLSESPPKPPPPPPPYVYYTEPPPPPYSSK